MITSASLSIIVPITTTLLGLCIGLFATLAGGDPEDDVFRYVRAAIVGTIWGAITGFYWTRTLGDDRLTQLWEGIGPAAMWGVIVVGSLLLLAATLRATPGYMEGQTKLGCAGRIFGMLIGLAFGLFVLLAPMALLPAPPAAPQDTSATPEPWGYAVFIIALVWTFGSFPLFFAFRREASSLTAASTVLFATAVFVATIVLHNGAFEARFFDIALMITESALAHAFIGFVAAALLVLGFVGGLALVVAFFPDIGEGKVHELPNDGVSEYRGVGLANAMVLFGRLNIADALMMTSVVVGILGGFGIYAGVMIGFAPHARAMAP